MSGTELVSVCIAIASGIYAFSKNASSIKNDVINAYETRVKQLEQGLGDMSKRMKELEMQSHAKDDRIKMMEAVLQGRNPEMIQAIQLMNKHMEATSKILGNIEMFMEKFSSHFQLV